MRKWLKKVGANATHQTLFSINYLSTNIKFARVVFETKHTVRESADDGFCYFINFQSVALLVSFHRNH